MDYPFTRSERYDVSNNWWFLPTDFFKVEKERQQAESHIRYSPILSYIEEINYNDRFKYSVIILVIILFIYRLDLSSPIWMGLIIGLMLVYYLNEIKTKELSTKADQLWTVLKSPLLKGTKYFISAPELIRWVHDVSELKAVNTLDFNKMIRTLDKMLQFIYDFKRGIKQSSAIFDIILDLKTSSLNQFHSFIHNIKTPVLRKKYNFYLDQLGKILNNLHADILKICKDYYQLKPVDNDSQFTMAELTYPTNYDPLYDEHYNFYN